MPVTLTFDTHQLLSGVFPPSTVELIEAQGWTFTYSMYVVFIASADGKTKVWVSTPQSVKTHYQGKATAANQQLYVKRFHAAVFKLLELTNKQSKLTGIMFD